ncbi:PQQ-dependent sugar dehydrogenase [Catalinimonas niigatensis]|uniref:PQQ-dependent sugar dehydrogenase n=1 Tax=Catalinimonas niigatensis TaxID=1397264 RepID=UPI0026650F09|nr:PQQ-dependent sugar dehydrogenase [Catalinimonas niigatensis]WPP51975.1 PQQ-dependent sugar dehydrogenase [Catalinimonas niigatensis]
MNKSHFFLKKIKPYFYCSLVIITCSTSCNQTTEAEVTDAEVTKPDDNRFTKIILAEQLDEPMQFEILDDGRILFVERKGKIKFYNTKTSQTSLVGEIPVSIGYYDKDGNEISPTGEDGMQGVVVDPDFINNGFIYLYYSPQGGAHRSILTRYIIQGDTLVHSSKKILLTVNNQRESCCHLGGGMLFDSDGNLYLSTGDNTQNDSRGYAPLDNRPGRERFDSQRTSSNTNSLRGKILRIHPEADGTYTIPEGNLYPVGTPKTRPEIYTMGNRNPWRLSLDSQTGYLYWGEVGPGGIVDSIGMGPKSYDEFNVARKAANFGWPYFIANNKPYWRYDYETKKSFEKFDSLLPLNQSKNNTGLDTLPPAEPAMIWYPQSQAIDFPLLGSGSNSAVGGPIFHQKDFKDAERLFPDYHEGKWFITDWTRGWIMAVTLNDDGGFESMEEFFPNIDLNGPIDMGFGPEGDLYVLEYGRGPYMRNQEARLIRIEYTAGNRKPIAVASTPQVAGAVPFKVPLLSKGSTDYDNDELAYTWEVSKEGQLLHSFNNPSPEVTLGTPGKYHAKLTVVDAAGLKSESTLVLFAGNEPPQIKFDFGSYNRTFFFPDTSIDYQLSVTDKEDGSLADKSIPESDIKLQIDYLENDFNIEKISKALEQNPADKPFIHILANEYITGTDCRSCHAVDKKLIGPSYKEISERYQDNKDARSYLRNKILKGGKGQWEAELAMPAHPSLSDEAVNTIVDYILSLNAQKQGKTLPIKGKYTYTVPEMTNPGVGAFKSEKSLRDKFLFRASYADKGAEKSITQSSTALLVLSNPTVPVAFFDKYIDATINHRVLPEKSTVKAERSGAAIVLENIDITGITEIEFQFRDMNGPLNLDGWKIEVRLNGKTGKLIGEINDSTISKDKERALNMIARSLITPTTGRHDLYLIFVNSNAKEKSLEEVQLNTVTFFNQ